MAAEDGGATAGGGLVDAMRGRLSQARTYSLGALAAASGFGGGLAVVSGPEVSLASAAIPSLCPPGVEGLAVPVSHDPNAPTTNTAENADLRVTVSLDPTATPAQFNLTWVIKNPGDQLRNTPLELSGPGGTESVADLGSPVQNGDGGETSFPAGSSFRIVDAAGVCIEPKPKLPNPIKKPVHHHKAKAKSKATVAKGKAHVIVPSRSPMARGSSVLIIA